MAPAVEIVTFPSSEAFQKDPSISTPVLDIVDDSKGSLGMYYGLQVEDGKTGYIVVVWESLEAHQDLINAPIYATLIEHVKKCVQGGGLDGLEMVHVPFEPSVAPIFNGPFTAFGRVVSLKPGKTEADLTAAIQVVLSAKDVKGSTGATYGKTLEKEQWAFATGWGQVEDHGKARETDPQIQQFLASMKEVVAEYSVAHVHLVDYKRKYQ